MQQETYVAIVQKKKCLMLGNIFGEYLRQIQCSMLFLNLFFVCAYICAENSQSAGFSGSLKFVLREN